MIFHILISADNMTVTNITAAQANLVLVPKVTSVTAINGTKVAVTFNKAIDKNTISVSDFTFTALDVNSGSTNVITTGAGANVAGTLSADGKTYTIVTNDGTNFFSGRYDVKLPAGVIKSTDNQDVAKYSATLTFGDTNAPVIASVVATPLSATTASIAITFDEQVATIATGGAGTLTINGVAYQGSVVPATLSTDRLTVTYPSVTINSDTAYAATLVGAKDIKGNIAGISNFSVTATADITKPTVTMTATNTTLNLKFSEKVDLTTGPATVTINGSPIVGGFTKDTTDLTETTYTFDASAALGASTFLNNAKVDLAAFRDLAGNIGLTTTAYLNFNTDTTAPVLVSKELVDNQLVLKFDEKVKDNGTTIVIPAVTGITYKVVDVTGLNLSFVNANGVLIPIPATTTWTAVQGKDLNGNGTIDPNTDEEKYVVVTFAETVPTIFGTDSKLLAGNYTFSWAKGAFTDVALNKVAAASFVLSPTNSSSSTASVTYTATVSGLKPVNTKFTVAYNEDMAANALNVANYQLGGAALPAGSTATFYGDTKTVLITLPQGSITANGTRTLVAQNVTAATGNTINTDAQTLQTMTMKENVLPTLSTMVVNSANKATATFSEAISGVVGGVTIKVNGATDAGTVTVNADGTLNIATVATLTPSSVVTLVFDNTTLGDANGNLIANN